MRRSRSLLAASLLLAGCHHQSREPSLADFYSSVAAAEATLAVCELGLAPATASAEYGLSESAALEVAEETAELAAGELTFDPTQAGDCLADLTPPALCWGASASVQALLLALPASCLAAVQGTVAPGAPCRDDSVCRGGSCNVNDCPGSCVAGLADGGACTVSAQCDSGLTCNVTVCAPPGAAGNDCQKNNECQPGLVCITVIQRANGGPLTPDGTCSTPIAGGDACDPEYSNPCAAGYWCAADAGSTTTGTCVAQVAAGGACTVGHGPTGFTEALESAQCLGHQICLGLQVDSAGDPTTPGTCAVPHDVGGTCVSTGVAATQGCYLGLLCDPTGHCVAPPETGEPCAVPPSDNSGLLVDYCAPGNYCSSPANGGTCTAKLADGTAGCSGNLSCLSGSCASGQICATATSSACTPAMASRGR